MSLRGDLRRLRAEIAAAAQAVYDAWDPDDPDCEYGDGGICDAIAEAQDAVIAAALDDVEIRAGGHDGDDHAWSIVQRPSTGEAAGVNIPPDVYEIGGGYSWEKIDGVRFKASDVEIFAAVFEDEEDL